MESILTEIILKICSVLNKHSVQYIIVGGTAVALHGYFRPSMKLSGGASDKPDLDFWYNPVYENYFKLLNALEDIGQNVKEFKAEQTPTPKKSYFRYEFEDYTLDLLPGLKAPLKFKESFDKKVVIRIHEIDIPFISIDDLIVDKESTQRPKDVIDIEQLKNLRKPDDE